MPDIPQVSAILLAAGLSRRLGRNKLLLRLGGEPIVRRAARALAHSKASEVLVVTGHESEEVRAVLAGLGVRFAHNARFAEGQGFSLIEGLAQADPEAEGLLFALGDQPFLSSPLIDRLIDAFSHARPRPLVVAPFHGQQRGTPTLFSAELREELSRLSGDVGARGVLQRVRAEAPARFATVPVEDEGIFLDLDTEADYARLLHMARGKPGEETASRQPRWKGDKS